MSDDELDDLYAVRPDGFTALRTELARAAKGRGDSALAKQISSARRPTLAAWIVTRLALEHNEARRRLSGLGDRLRAAHAALDGESIRMLSAEQRVLVDELAREAFALAEVGDPSAALRDDVGGTLQAAIADPEVCLRLGRLTKAERWSGFVVDSGHEAASVVEDDDQRRESLRTAVAHAERVAVEAEHTMSEREEALAAAQSDREEARRALLDAERAVEAAQAAYLESKHSACDARARLKDAKASLSQEE